MVVEDEAVVWTKEFGKEVSDAMVAYVRLCLMLQIYIFRLTLRSMRLCLIMSICCNLDSVLVYLSPEIWLDLSSVRCSLLYSEKVYLYLK